jgi:REP element-mobilizing transposase RayT
VPKVATTRIWIALAATVIVMAHALRIEEPGGIYNVGSRGNDKQTIFYDDVDRIEFLRLLAKVAVRHFWKGWAYCLMGNHFHLLVQIPHGGLSSGMQLLNTGYAIRTNKRHGRTGHLVRNRFYSELVEDDSHLAELYRYLVLNPVRAGLCAAPDAWPWSSYRASAGLEIPHPFLDVTRLLRLFGRRPDDAARAANRRFIWDGFAPTRAGVPPA